MTHLAGVKAGADTITAHVVAGALAHEARPRLRVGVAMFQARGCVCETVTACSIHAAPP